MKAWGEPLTMSDMEITGDPSADLDPYLLPDFPAAISPLDNTTVAVSFAPDELKDYTATVTVQSDVETGENIFQF